VCVFVLFGFLFLFMRLVLCLFMCCLFLFIWGLLFVYLGVRFVCAGSVFVYSVLSWVCVWFIWVPLFCLCGYVFGGMFFVCHGCVCVDCCFVFIVAVVV